MAEKSGHSQADEEDLLLFDQLLDVSACTEDDLLSVCGSSILDSESLLGGHEDLEPCATPTTTPSLPPPTTTPTLPPPTITPLQQRTQPQPSDGREPDCARGEGAGVLGGVIQLNQRMGFRYVPENLPLVEMPTLARGCGRGKRKGHISKKSRPHRIVSEPSLLLATGSPHKRQKRINDLRMMITANRQARAREQPSRAVSVLEGQVVAESRVAHSTLTPSLEGQVVAESRAVRSTLTPSLEGRLGSYQLPPSMGVAANRLGGCQLSPVTAASLQNQDGRSVLVAVSPLTTSELSPTEQMNINTNLGAMETTTNQGTGTSTRPGAKRTSTSPGIGTSPGTLGLSFQLLPSQSIFVCRPGLVNKRPGGFSLSHLRQSPTPFSLNHLRS